ncbi:putative complement factor H-like 5, partial [Homarus americanus]
MVNFTCPDNMGAEGEVATQSLTCIRDDTVYPPFIYDPPVVKPCNVCLGLPHHENGTVTKLPATDYEVGDFLQMDCIANHMYDIGEVNVLLYCNDTGWENASCYEGCVSAPPALGLNQQSTTPDTYALGTNITYTCNETHYIEPTVVSTTTTTTSSITTLSYHYYYYYSK